MRIVKSCGRAFLIDHVATSCPPSPRDAAAWPLVALVRSRTAPKADSLAAEAGTSGRNLPAERALAANPIMVGWLAAIRSELIVVAF